MSVDEKPPVQDWSRVGCAITTRRAELAMTQVELCRAASLSDLTVRRLEQGAASQYRAATLGRLEAALGWAPGTIIALASGRDPSLPELPASARLTDITARLEVLERRVDELTATTGRVR